MSITISNVTAKIKNSRAIGISDVTAQSPTKENREIGISEVKSQEQQAIEFFGLRKCDAFSDTIAGLVLDIVDTADPSFLTNEYNTISKAAGGAGSCRSDAQLLVKGELRAVPAVIDKVLEIVKSSGKIRLLRIHGHGFPGFQSVWGGPIAKYVGKKMTGQQVKKVDGMVASPLAQWGIGTANLATLAGTIMKLAPAFLATGELWLMGCNVAEGPLGRELINRLTTLLGVTVKAATPIQYSSKKQMPDINFLHEGEILQGVNPFETKGFIVPD